jgi:L-asparaginase
MPWHEMQVIEMKKILLIGTGGTIASDITASGLAPELSAQQLLAHIPAISDICQVDCLQLMNLDSTDMAPANLLEMAACIREQYDAYDGFVIAHGTDTMAYTAAALSYLVQGSPKPIVLTGAQKPIGFDSTDSKINLIDAFRCATEDMPGVSIVFNNHVILGTRAKKTRTKSFQAFSSINYPDLGVLRDGTLLRYIRQESREAPLFYHALNTKVALMKLIPGVGREQADFLLERNDALIIESFGVGGLPAAGGFYDCLRDWMDKGKTIVLTTQVESEGSDLGVYHVGHSLKMDLRVLEAYDMTTEAVVAKLMWILGRTKDRSEIEKLFYTPVAHDILWPAG